MIQLAGAENGNSAKNVMIRTSDLEEMQKREVLDALKEKIGDYNVLRTERVLSLIHI